MSRKSILPIRNEDEYKAALREIEKYFEKEPKPDTPAAHRFDMLALIIKEYETRRWPLGGPDHFSR